MAQIAPSAAQRRLLELHLDELERWNLRMNLTAVPRQRAWEKHVVEALALLAAAGPVTGARCADLGSGGGIPGVALAILRPDLSMTLVESDRRKAGFLVHVAGLLDLPNIDVVARRAEEMAREPGHRAAYDVVVSRAAAEPVQLVEISMPLLWIGGVLWALVTDAPAAVDRLAGAPRVRAWVAGPGVLAVEKLGTRD